MRDQQRAMLGPRRVGMRLGGYDYSTPGYYFITTCTHFRMNLFGEIVSDSMLLNSMGKVVAEKWRHLTQIFPFVDLDESVVMPNHFHGIVVIRESTNGGSRAATTSSVVTLSRIVNAFKTTAGIAANEVRGSKGSPVWQHRYYDHIVRDEADLYRVRAYIRNNPLKWALDEENPESQSFAERLRSKERPANTNQRPRSSVMDRAAVS